MHVGVATGAVHGTAMHGYRNSARFDSRRSSHYAFKSVEVFALMTILRRGFAWVSGVIVFSVVIAAGYGSEFNVATGDIYEVYSQVSSDHAEATVEKLEALSTLYNDYFRFETDELPSELRVRIFERRDEFDEYLSDRIDVPRNEFVYLHFTDAARSELVGYIMDDEETYRASMIHQSVVQFVRAFIPNPPLWLREGFAVYFEESRYDPEQGEAEFRKNTAWIEPLQDLVDDRIEQLFVPSELVTISADDAAARLETFYAQAWGAVSFLRNAEKSRYNRILWDAIGALDPDASARRNAELVERKALRWIDEQELASAFVNYVQGLRTFRALVERGIEAYTEERFELAEEYLRDAIESQGESYVPWYYLGLIHYARTEFEDARTYYEAARDRGADEAVTLYALGLNAFGADERDDAIEYLRAAAEADPDRYRERAESLIEQLEG